MISEETAAAAEAMTKRICGPTIMMGNGSYFDYERPEATTMDIEDYAWGLCASGRFRGQTRHPVTKDRCLYYVCQHVCEGAGQMLDDGYSPRDAFGFLMHESDESVLGDMPGPVKPLLGAEYRPFCKMIAAGIDQWFEVPEVDHDLIKRYDVRMLATEKRDLMPDAAGHDWSGQPGLAAMNDYDTFPRLIVPQSPDQCVRRFLGLFHTLRGAA